MTASLTQEELHFSPSRTNVASIARQVYRASTSQSISARLRSIDADAAFVAEEARQKALPLIANERCGSWYVPPALKAGSVYFKSTDGHVNEWAFSLRRLNLHLLPIIGKHGGCTIVDATRRGKHAPDALAKTIPIWCAVLNNLLFPDERSFHTVRLHSKLTSASERAQIAALIPHFVRQAQSLGLDWSSLKDGLERPLQPEWIVRSLPHDGALKPRQDMDIETHKVYLCMSSNFTETSEDNGYVQGAGDDSESWAQGLTAKLFWSHREELLKACEAELPTLIAGIREASAAKLQPAHKLTQVSTHPRLLLGSLNVSLAGYETIPRIVISSMGPQMTDTMRKDNAGLLHLKCATGKSGSRALRSQLTRVADFMQKLPENSSVVVQCPTGTDLCVGVAVSILCMSLTDVLDEHLTASTSQPRSLANISMTSKWNEGIDKSTIKRMLAGIVSAFPAANPSRATLTAVNSFLMRGNP